MQDSLKQFMEVNQAAFEEELPQNTWENLEKQLPQKRSYVLLRRLVAVAAAVLLVFGFGTLTGIYFTSNNAPMVNESPELEEYQETEAYYSKLVNQKIDELKSLQQGPRTNKDIAELESSFNEWKLELGTSFTDEEIMGIMVQHYQRKIEILELTLEKVRKTKQHPTNL